jgi:thioredoxin-dependent peroxiredoxin
LPEFFKSLKRKDRQDPGGNFLRVVPAGKRRQSMQREGLSMAKLSRNDAAPEFELRDQHGETVKLADFGGGKLLIYFYPKADTPGCTRQACSIRDAREEFVDLGLAVVGISPDQPARQQKFDDKYGLNFPLLADPDHRVAEAYGAWGEKTSYGKKTQGIIRSSFLIDAAGKIVAAWYGVKPEDTVPKAQKALAGG